MKNSSLSSLLCGFLFAGIVASPASQAMATLIFDNGTPNTFDGFTLGRDAYGQPGYATADNFKMINAASVDGVGFYFQNFNGITGWDRHISYAIHAGTAGMPGAILASGIGQNVAPVQSGFPWAGGGNAWLVTFDLAAPFAASGGTDYWLELGGAGGLDPWWVTTGLGTPGPSWAMLNGLAYHVNTADVAFYLRGVAVPEPSALILFGMGAFGLLAWTWRRNRKAV